MPIQTTANTASPTTFTNKTWYDRTLLDNAVTQFVHQQFGQKRTIPKNNGKHVEFRKWSLFNVDTAALELTEGVTPESQNIAQTKVEATIKQYGAYVNVTDLLDLTAVDPVIDDMSALLGEQLGTVLDWVTRDAMIAGASAQYANGLDSMLAITPSDKMTITEIRKAVRTLKKSKARRFTDGGKPHFVCISDPDCIFDLQNDALWQDAAKYSNVEQLYTGEMGFMFGVRFVESTEGKVTKQSVNNAVSAATTSVATFVLANDPTAEEVAYLSKGGNKIKIGGVEYTLASTGSYTAATKTVKLSAAASLAQDAVVASEDAGSLAATTYKGTEVHHNLCFGADAYGVIDISGSGNVQSIVKPFGSGDDPLNQRATVAGKITAYCAKVLNSLWIIDIMSAAS